MGEVMEFSHVDVAYNGVLAVSDVSFPVEKGEILGIAGESGSGKSTLIRAAMGLLGPGGMVTKGDIYYEGRDLPNLPPRELRRLCGSHLGMIFQDAGAFFMPTRRIGDQMLEAARAHESVSRKAFQTRARAALSDLGFPDPDRILRAYPFELSGGMQQRAAIACAMLLSPEILFADEPTSALDVSTQRQIIDELMELRDKTGITIVLVSHNIGLIRYMADRILIMKEGRRMEYGSTGDVLTHPASPYTRRLVAAVPSLFRGEDI